MTHNMHGTIINYTSKQSLSIIPTRSQLLDAATFKDVSNTIRDIDAGNRVKKLYFLPNDFKEFHEKDNGCLRYKLLLYGILKDGRKASVVIDDIKPYLEIRKPKSMSDSEFYDAVSDALTNLNINSSTMSKIRKKSFEEFEIEPQLYIHIVFNTLWDRKKILDYAHKSMRWKTTSDDSNHFERVICRDGHRKICTWNDITNYSSFEKVTESKLDKTFRIKWSDFKDCPESVIMADEKLFKDKTLIDAWDIEAYSDSAGDMPDANKITNKVFQISKIYCFRCDKEPILNIGLSCRKTTARPGYLTILCASEKDLIKASFELNSILQPDIITDFNGGEFDWPFIITKACIYKILVYIYDQLSMFVDYRASKMDSRELQKSILTWNCTQKKIKLEANDSFAYSTCINAPGYICMDMRTMLRQIHATDGQSSLKHYLEVYKLQSKLDMPIKELFRIYKESLDIDIVIKLYKETEKVIGEKFQSKIDKNVEDMTAILEYCIRDSQQVHALALKTNVIADKREISNISYTTLYDAIYLANGMKVRNLIMSYSNTFGILFSSYKEYNGRREEGSFQGATVISPVKGPVKPKLSIRERKETLESWKNVHVDDLDKMEDYVLNDITEDKFSFKSNGSHKLFNEFVGEKTQYPIQPFDFESLYPSIAITWNISPEMIIYNETLAMKLVNEGYTIEDLGAYGIIFRGEVIKAWCVRHDTYDGVKLLPNKSVNRFGLYPTILKELFDKRRGIKAQVKIYEGRKHKLEALGGGESKDNDLEESKNSTEYEDICFNIDYFNSKQKALKVFMNTFYGEAGNPISPIFTVAVAGGITAIGRKYLQHVCDKFRSLGYTIMYGDTDSAYVMGPARLFTEVDRLYYGGKMLKEVYGKELVEISDTTGLKLADSINDYLVELTDTVFLRMAIEPTGYPAWFFMKKMYAFKHGDHIVTKGIANNRRGCPPILKQVSLEVLEHVLDIRTCSDPFTVVTSKIREVYKRKWGLSDFIKTAVYKPSKQNVSVRTFSDRMIEMANDKYPAPAPGDRFEFVIVKKYPYKYDIKGRKSELSVGEKMEYYDYAVENNLPVDLDYYMEKGVIAQFAQFISYVAQFQVIPIDGTDEESDKADKKTVTVARKYIENICKSLSSGFKCKGPLLKELYKNASDIYKQNVKATIPSVMGKQFDKLVKYDYINNSELFDYIRESIRKDCDKKATIYAERYISYMKKKHGNNIIYGLLSVFATPKIGSLLYYRTEYLRKIEYNSKKVINEQPDISDLFTSRDQYIKELMKHITNKIQTDKITLDDYNSLSDEDKSIDMGCVSQEVTDKINNCKETVKTLDNIYNLLHHSIGYVKNTEAIIERLKFYTEAERQENPIPPGIIASVEVSSSVEWIRNSLSLF